MGFLPYPAFFTFILLIIWPTPAYSLCPSATCTNSTVTPIRFPFRLQHQQPENCSYPGFNLYCSDQGLTALTLPHSGKFLVRFISYVTQNIRLYDPDNCLPRRFLDGFDTSASPFQADIYVNYTFLSCPKNFTDDRFTIIDCLSNSTTSVMATSLSILAQKVSNKSCQIIKTLPVPASSPQVDGFTSTLTDDLWLSWDVPDCKDCEVQGGFCGFQRNDNKQIGCFYDLLDSGNSEDTQNSKGVKIFRIVVFIIAFPAILCAMGIGIFLCVTRRRDATGTLPNSRAEQPQDTTAGLDQATIDSYTKVVVGESRRIPGLNDGLCPICLSDFSVKETLRYIPDCEHCFHVDCIDEWLKMNGSCPLCRNSPTLNPQVQLATARIINIGTDRFDSFHRTLQVI